MAFTALFAELKLCYLDSLSCAMGHVAYERGDIEQANMGSRTLGHLRALSPSQCSHGLRLFLTLCISALFSFSSLCRQCR